MKKTLSLAVLSLVLIPAAGRAQFFDGIVYDPTNFHNAVLRYYQLRMRLAKLQQTYQQVLNQYNLAVQMAKNIQNMPARYKAYFSQWRYLTTVPDVYQNTGRWVNGVNTGTLSTVLSGYQKATTPLRRYSSAAIAAMSPQELQRATTAYATVEIADAKRRASAQSRDFHRYGWAAGALRNPRADEPIEPARARARGSLARKAVLTVVPLSSLPRIQRQKTRKVP